MNSSPELAIQELRLIGPTGEAVDRFIQGHEFPIREGPHTTFVYRGEASSVLLGHWLFGTAAAREMQRIAGSDLWFLTLDLPAESRVEYRFQRVRGADAEWILDPLNERTVRDPFGVWSVCHGQGYERPEWTEPDPLVGEGEHLVYGGAESGVRNPAGIGLYPIRLSEPAPVSPPRGARRRGVPAPRGLPDRSLTT